ncbi:hypothetical protein Droror1_Dr00021738 [Drosera rotundifolia]
MINIFPALSSSTTNSIKNYSVNYHSLKPLNLATTTVVYAGDPFKEIPVLDVHDEQGLYNKIKIKHYQLAAPPLIASIDPVSTHQNQESKPQGNDQKPKF